MSKSQIEWTDTTWNPVSGCTIVSEGCKNCYAMNFAKRLESMGMAKYKELTRKSGKRTVWNGKVRLDENSLVMPLKWRKPRQVFVNSMSDLFHDGVNVSFIEKVWDIMKRTPQHNYQILTKRPLRMAEFVNNLQQPPLPNVWLGTSVENKANTTRIEILQKIPSVVKFISFEPLIGPVGFVDLTGIDWAIVGGESGNFARPIDVKWVDDIFVQCKESKVAFFFKQWGSWGPDKIKRSKKANGRVYKGQIWSQMPNISKKLRNVSK